MKANGTAVYQRLHKRGLTMPQLNAINLLAAGKTDKETALLLGLSRTCVSKWRLYDPVFQAALNRRRAEVWASGIDRLRSLIPQALNVLAEHLEPADNPNRWKVAVEILKLTDLPAIAPDGPTDPIEVVEAVVTSKREKARTSLNDLCDSHKGLPPFQRHVDQTWQDMEAALTEPDEAEKQS